MKKHAHPGSILIVTTLLLLPLSAFAHTGTGHASGFGYGFAHPLLGWDHLLAMVAVGIWAAQIGGRARWLLPVTFVATLLAGAAIGFTGLTLPFVETGILLSVLVLGAVIGLAYQPTAAMGALLVAGFALFHGYAHGTEMPANLSGLTYGLGFASATALLQLGGMSAILLLQRLRAERLARVAGMAIAVGGVYLAVA